MARAIKIGFELFDNPKLVAKLDKELRRLGHALVLDQPDETLISEYDALILPLGKGEGFVLRLVQDWEQVWSTGVLCRRPNFHELDRIEFDRDVRTTSSCYDAWIETITLAVRRHVSEA
jgi:hypothetical protein